MGYHLPSQNPIRVPTIWIEGEGGSFVVMGTGLGGGPRLILGLLFVTPTPARSWHPCRKVGASTPARV